MKIKKKKKRTNNWYKCFKRKLSTDITLKDLKEKKRECIVLSNGSMMESYHDQEKLMAL